MAASYETSSNSPMKRKSLSFAAIALCASSLLTSTMSAQIGRRFPSEKKNVSDPVTGTPLTFLTSTPAGDTKIYPTHQQWTADGKWLIFRSQRAPGQAMAVNEDTGVMVQVTEKGYLGMLCNARHSMRLYIMRDVSGGSGRGRGANAAAGVPAGGTVGATTSTSPAPATVSPGADTSDIPGRRGGFNRRRGPFQIIEIDLTKLFADKIGGAHV
jgi:hypothetical protein